MQIIKTINETDFISPFIFMHVAMATVHTSALVSKKRKFVLLTCLLPFLKTKLRIKDFREKGLKNCVQPP